MHHRRHPRKLLSRAKQYAAGTIALVVLTSGITFPAAAYANAGAAAPRATQPVVVDPCAGTTSTNGGALNTPTRQTWPAQSDATKALEAGKTVFLYTNSGGVVTNDAGSFVSTGQGGLPYCGTKLADASSGDLTNLEPDWRFCVDEGKAGCADRPPGASEDWTTSPSKRLNDAQKMNISSLLLNADLSTKRTRALVQTQIWCISESVQPGSVNTDAHEYFNRYQFKGEAKSNDESRPFTEAEARCAYLPDQPKNPSLTLAGPSTELATGDAAEFTVTTNLSTPIALTTTGTALQLCPAGQPGVTFNGNAITFSSPGSATVCTSSASTATVQVTVDSGDIPIAGGITEVWNQERSCQVFADFVAGTSENISRSATAQFRGDASFAISKQFDGLELNDGDLDDVVVPIKYQVISPAGVTPATGTIWLTPENGFAGVGPTYPDGTVIEIEEGDITGLPPAIAQTGFSWTIDGQPAPTGPIRITIGDQVDVQLVVTNAVRSVKGTFELLKSFVLPPEISNLDGIEVTVGWDAPGYPQNDNLPLLLSNTKDFRAFPRDAAGDIITFPIGTVITLDEIGVTGPPELAGLDPSWGSNADPSDPTKGLLTIAEEWNPGEPATVSEISLVNGVHLATGSLVVRKTVDGMELGEGEIDDLVITAIAQWPGGANVVLLNAENNWTTGLGVNLPVGTLVTLTEVSIESSGPSISWNDVPAWECADCDPNGFIQNDNGSASVTIGANSSPVVTAVNSFELLTGGFEVSKQVSGDIDLDDPRIADVKFVVNWTSTDAAQPNGTLVLEGADWRAQPLDESGDPLVFPLGTVIDLTEVGVSTPAIPGVEWGSDVTWSIGDQNDGTARIVISEHDTVSSIVLTNGAELREGTFSIAKYVHSNNELDLDDIEFTVTYSGGGIDGSLVVKDRGTATSVPFPEGTVVTLNEILPSDAMPDTEGWQTPEFVLPDGTRTPGPVEVVVIDGQDVRISLVNTVVEKPTEPTDPTKPTHPTEPTKPSTLQKPAGSLPQTGANDNTVALLTAAALLALFGTWALTRRRSRFVSVNMASPQDTTL